MELKDHVTVPLRTKNLLARVAISTQVKFIGLTGPRGA
jgi:hypothetical protein